VEGGRKQRELFKASRGFPFRVFSTSLKQSPETHYTTQLTARQYTVISYQSVTKQPVSASPPRLSFLVRSLSPSSQHKRALPSPIMAKKECDVMTSLTSPAPRSAHLSLDCPWLRKVPSNKIVELYVLRG